MSTAVIQRPHAGIWTTNESRKGGTIETAPEGGATPVRGLTHSSDESREGLPVDATRVCEACNRVIPRKSKWSSTYYQSRRWCNKACKDAARPSIIDDYTVNDDGCWVWQGPIDRNGYGKAYDGSRPPGKRVDWAHRVSYRRHRGEIPDGTELDHTCQNTRCVNPEHLDPITRAEHVRRTVERAGGLDRQRQAAHLREKGLTYAEIAEAFGLLGRSSGQGLVKRAIKNGLVDPSAVPPVQRLTESQREDIRDLYALGIPQPEIARWYRVDDSQISRIVNGRNNGHRVRQS